MKHSALLLIAALTAAASVRAEPLELDESVVDHVRQIHAIDPERRDDVFSKMGGSSVASQAFLHCFATEYVDLGERPELAETIDFFVTGRRNSFNRQSEAAGVSWNLRYVLGGRPASFRVELEETGARWALVLFGGNDAQNENERVYLKRLVYLVEQLEEMGVVPILGSAMPRRNASKDRWIHRFNLITEAVAKHWSLPYIDYHGALSALPRKGLARDGVHPNVLPPGGYKTSCQLTEEGLRYGNNLRNLLTLEMLDTLRRVTDSGADETPANASPQGEARRECAAKPAGRGGRITGGGGWAGCDQASRQQAPLADAGAGTDAGTAPDLFPIFALVDKAALPPAAPLPSNCGGTKPGSRHYKVELSLEERTRLRAAALDLDGHDSRLLLVRNDEETGARCVRRRRQILEVDARPGMWDLIVEVPDNAAEEGQMLILIARDPR